jgi:hypothetical protein
VKELCFGFIKAHGGLVSSHPTFNCLEECGNAKLAVQVARAIAGGSVVSDSSSTLMSGRGSAAVAVNKRKRE